jgi:hypothetical protein
MSRSKKKITLNKRKSKLRNRQMGGSAAQKHASGSAAQKHASTRLTEGKPTQTGLPNDVKILLNFIKTFSSKRDGWGEIDIPDLSTNIPANRQTLNNHKIFLIKLAAQAAEAQAAKTAEAEAQAQAALAAQAAAEAKAEAEQAAATALAKELAAAELATVNKELAAAQEKVKAELAQAQELAKAQAAELATVKAANAATATKIKQPINKEEYILDIIESETNNYNESNKELLILPLLYLLTKHNADNDEVVNNKIIKLKAIICPNSQEQAETRTDNHEENQNSPHGVVINWDAYKVLVDTK